MPSHDDIWRYWNKTRNEIPDNINTLTEEEIINLLTQWEGGVWTGNKPDKKQILQNIKLLPEIDIKVTIWIMDRIKECTDDFVKQRWLSSIALTGAICEYLSFYLLQDYIKQNGIFPIIEDSGLLKQQHDRIILLRRLNIINENERADLKIINDIRNKYLHVHTTDYSTIKDNCLDIIKKMISLLTNHPINHPQ